MYLVTVIDICSRRVVGWSIADHIRTGLVADAIEMAVHTRGGDVRGVIVHNDRGSQYTAATFVDVCHRHGIRPSRGRIGRAMTTLLPSRSSKDSRASGCTAAVGSRRAIFGRSCSSGLRTTTGVVAIPPWDISRRWSSSGSFAHRLRCHSLHEIRCPPARGNLSGTAARIGDVDDERVLVGGACDPTGD